MGKIGISIIRNSLVPYVEVKTGADSYSVKKHSHKELSIGFIENGSSSIKVRELDFELTMGQALLIPPETVHLCSPFDPDKFIFKVVYVDNSWFSGLFGVDSDKIAPQKADLKNQDKDLLNNFCDAFDKEKNSLNIVSITVDFLEKLVLDLFKMEKTKEEIHGNGPVKIKAFIDNNYKEDLKLDELCDIAKTDKFRLIRSFKKSFKLTPHSYLVNKRIEYARELLIQGSSVADAAVSSGFFDQSHFVKTFRSYTGLNPGDYKKS